RRVGVVQTLVFSVFAERPARGGALIVVTHSENFFLNSPAFPLAIFLMSRDTIPYHAAPPGTPLPAPGPSSTAGVLRPGTSAPSRLPPPTAPPTNTSASSRPIVKTVK